MSLTQECSDAELLRAAGDGDVTALRELYDRHAPWLSIRLTRRCNDAEVVADVVQDTFVTAWKDAAKWRGDGELAAWLWGIAFRTMVSRLRKRREVVLMPNWDAAPGLDGTRWDGGRQVSPALEDQVLVSVEYGDLGTALSRLSPEFRAVVQACILDGLTTREASALLGVRENTVKTRLHRAKRELRTSLAPTYQEGWL